MVFFLLPSNVAKPRGAAALRAALLRFVRPGSRIVHDDWGAYRAMDWTTLPFAHDARSVVNHSKEIKNRFGQHTNHIEAVWSSFKRWLRRRLGGRLNSSLLPGYISEFLWLARVPPGPAARMQALLALLRETPARTLQNVSHAPGGLPLLASDNPATESSEEAEDEEPPATPGAALGSSSSEESLSGSIFGSEPRQKKRRPQEVESFVVPPA